MAEQERLLAPHLAAGTPIYLEVGTKYTLMPKSWLQAWRSHVSAASRKGRAPGAALPDLPPSLREACEGLLCSCHRDTDARLAHSLPDLANRWACCVEPVATCKLAACDCCTHVSILLSTAAQKWKCSHVEKSSAQSGYSCGCSCSAHCCSCNWTDKVICVCCCGCCRRGRWMQTSPNDSVFEIVSTADWQQLLSQYSEHAEVRSAAHCNKLLLLLLLL